jgi:hypothetical protein
MAGSQTAFDAEQEIAQLVADHATGCAKLACTAKDASLDIALEMIVWPLAVLIVALLLQRAGFWDGLLRWLSARLKRAWFADAGFGAALAILFVAVSLPFGLYDVLTADPVTQSGFRCPKGTKDCPFPELTLADMVWSFLDKQLGRAEGLAVVFAVLAPLAFALQRKRPRVLLVMAGGAYLAWQLVPLESRWDRTYPLPESPLSEDVSRIAGRAGITMERVLMGQPKPLRADGGGEANWHGSSVKAVISERLLNIHALHPRSFSPPPVPATAAEVRFVAAHEIAHLRHHHVEWSALASLIFTILCVSLAADLARKRASQGTTERRDTTAGFLAVFLALGFALHFVHVPIYINLQRAFENQADATALDLARDPNGAIAFTLNEGRGEPLALDRWYHVFYRTHPDNLTRLRRAVEWKTRNESDTWRAQGLTGPVRWRFGDEVKLVTDWPEKTGKSDGDGAKLP